MHVKQNTFTAGCILTEGDELYCEVRGNGQPLLMISGAGGDAGFYTAVANILSDEYTVITYDRRGNSRSTSNIPQNFEVSQQARDAVAVLRALGYKNALIFGNSAGAIISLEIARTLPEAAIAVVAHEPPALRMLPDGEKWSAFFAEIYHTAFVSGIEAAMNKFLQSVALPLSALASFPPDLALRNRNNHGFFVRHEMLPITNYLPDVSAIKNNGVPLIPAVGKSTLENNRYYGMTVPILAGLLGCEMAVFPGHHLSFLDMPGEWSEALRAVLHRVKS